MVMTEREAEQILRQAGLLTDVSPGQVLYGVMPGDKVRVKASLQYKGPALDDKFYVAIGVWRGITWPVEIGNFDEIWNNSPGTAVHFDSSTSFVTYNLQGDVLIKEVGIFAWTPGYFDLYAKIAGQGVYSARYDNVIEVLLKSQFQSFNIQSYEKIAGA